MQSDIWYSGLLWKERKAMSIEENKQLVVRWKEERNKGNVNVADELCTADCVLYMSGLPAPGPVRGRETFKQLFAAYLAAFDFTSMPEFLVAEGDMVVVRETYRLRHKGEFLGIPPTGKEVSVTGTEIYQVADGKFVASWVEVDMLGLMRQLGVLPEPAHGAS
jgi:predicted ester cyclase